MEVEDPTPVVAEALGVRPGPAEIRLLERLAVELPPRLGAEGTHEILSALREELLQAPGLSLADIHRKVAACRRCPSLEHPGRMPRWNLGRPDLVLVGESLTLHDERIKRIEEDLAVAGIKKERCALTGAVRCAGEAGAEEAQRCLPYLEAELAALSPRLVLALGSLPARALLGPDIRVGETRGRVFFAGPLALMVTWSLGYTFRGGRPLEEYHEDLQAARRFLDGT